MEKFIRDGEVAVLISPGFGAGWYTANPEYPSILWDPTLAQMVLEGRHFTDLTQYVETRYPGVYRGGLINLMVWWVPEGTRFRVAEYDGSETVVLYDDEDWHVA